MKVVEADPNSNVDGATSVPAEGRLRIMHVTAPAGFGGLERVVHALTRQLAEHGHAVELVVLLHGGVARDPFVGAFDGSDVAVRVLRLPSRAYIREYAHLRELIRERRPDVVHTHGYRCDIVARRAAAAEGVPAVSTSHGFSRGPLRNRFYEWLQRREFRRFNRVVAVSAPMAREIVASGVAAERVVVLPNAVPVLGEFLERAAARRELGLPADGFRIGWVGRFAWAKGLDIFVQSLASLGGDDWAASIIGDGPAGAAARSIAAQAGIAGRLTWHGALDHAARYLRAFDVVVISSRTEGTPMILLEAMAAGVPIVSTAVGGIPDVVGTAGALLVPPDDPTGIASAVRRIRSEPASAAARAEVALQAAKSREKTEWTAQYESCYESTLVSRTPERR